MGRTRTCMQQTLVYVDFLEAHCLPRRLNPTPLQCTHAGRAYADPEQPSATPMTWEYLSPKLPMTSLELSL